MSYIQETVHDILMDELTPELIDRIIKALEINQHLTSTYALEVNVDDVLSTDRNPDPSKSGFYIQLVGTRSGVNFFYDNSLEIHRKPSSRVSRVVKHYNHLKGFEEGFWHKWHNKWVGNGFKLRESDETNAMLDLMQHNDQFKDVPYVGSFWYDPNKDELFGIYSVLADREEFYKSKLFNQRVRTGTKLHKDIWRKEQFKKKDGRFNGDHTLVPRGRVFQLEDGSFKVMVGDWFDKYPQVKDEILFEFQLPEDTEFVKDEHWNIGRGFSDEFLGEEYIVEKIIKKSDGYYVTSEDGEKNLGGPYKKKEDAEKRLGQVEYLKSLKESDDIDDLDTVFSNLKRIEFYDLDGSNPVQDFILAQDDVKLQAKIVFDLKRLDDLGNKARKPLSDYVDDGILEMRTEQGNNISRVFYFFIFGDKIVMTNGYIKKTQKLDPKEFKLAKKRRDKYMKEKVRGDK